MGEVFEAPAKLNLSLRVGSRDSSGLHPIRSLVQTIDWMDQLSFESSDEDDLVVGDADVPRDESNLVWKAVRAVREETGSDRPRLRIELEKRIPQAAGLGGGSSDGAAALIAAADLYGLADPTSLAPGVGADVAYLLTGGPAWMEGHGELVSSYLGPELEFVVGAVVPRFELATPDVYERWDELGEPVASAVEPMKLAPSLRGEDIANDLLAAAVSIEPELGDWIHDLAGLWDRPILLAGSGPCVVGLFADADESKSAVDAVTLPNRGSRVASLWPTGAARVDR